MDADYIRQGVHVEITNAGAPFKTHAMRFPYPEQREKEKMEFLNPSWTEQDHRSRKSCVACNIKSPVGFAYLYEYCIAT